MVVDSATLSTLPTFTGSYKTSPFNVKFKQRDDIPVKCYKTNPVCATDLDVSLGREFNSEFLIEVVFVT